jgi:hypothetical protein
VVSPYGTGQRSSNNKALPDTLQIKAAALIHLKEKEKYKNLYQDGDGNIYALCCYECGVNTSRDAEVEVASFTIAKLRNHMSSAHWKKLTESETIEKRKGPAISSEDLALHVPWRTFYDR